jgi:flavin reductase
MSRIGSSVHIVTAGSGQARSGTTATAVCSVSDEPPTVLACLNRNSRTAAVVRENGVFAINTLTKGHESISMTFAGQTGAAGSERFSVGDWDDSEGVPMLRDASVLLRCDVVNIQNVGSHFVIFGLIKSVVLGQSTAGLMYYQRKYHYLDLASALAS